MSAGWRKGFADVVAAIKGTLADASNAGSISAAEFIKLAGLPASALATAWGDGFADVVAAVQGTLADASNPGSLAAADFSKLATAPAGALLLTQWRSALADLTIGQTVSIPIANPGDGRSFYMLYTNCEIGAVTGGPGSGTASLDLIANGGTWKTAFSTLPVTTITSVGPGTGNIVRLVSNSGPIVNPAQPLRMVIATPMGGYTSVPIRFTVGGYYA